jgi:flagellar assembly factor FliW
MIIDSLRFGQLEVSEEQIFRFPMGILGFAASKSFVIIDLESQKPFKWMQCIEDPSTAFVLSDPLLIHSSYCAVVRRAELEPLGSPADLQE